VDRALGFGVGSVELVPQHNPHLGQIFHTMEVFLDRVVDGEGKESFSIISSLLESFTGTLKVAVIDFAKVLALVEYVGGVSVGSFSFPVTIFHIFIDLRMFLIFIFQSM